MIDFISQPWPWYVGGTLIGLMVPLLLLLANKQFGVSSSFRHICAVASRRCLPYFDYNWKSEGLWNVLFVIGIIIGATIAVNFLGGGQTTDLSPATREALQSLGVNNTTGLVPTELISWSGLFSFKGFMLIVVGGFLVGFGTRYANGCTSGHSIMGMSNLQPGALLATMSFFAGGLLMTHLLLPLILN